MGSNQLHWADYLVFGASMMAAVIIGVISAFRHRGHATLEDYILGQRSMNPVVVAVSLIATIFDASILLLQPPETYLFGTAAQMGVIGIAIQMVLLVTLFIPTYHNMKLTSAYEYIEIRFIGRSRALSRSLRVAASFLNGASEILGAGITLYLPSLAFSQVTGLALWQSILVCALPCITYTTLGGLRAVVWVDAMQVVVMLGGLFLFIIGGSIKAGGGDVIIQRAKDGGRFNLDSFSVDPRVRYTLWSATIGQLFRGLSNLGANQLSIQRFMSVKNIRATRWVSFLAGAIGITLILLSGAVGVVIYGYFYGCDPIIKRDVTRVEQLIPYFMMDLLGHLHGLPGLFTSALFAAAMSTLSSTINAVCALAMVDFVKPAMKTWWHTDLSDRAARNCCTVFSLILGGLSIAAAFLPDATGGLVIEISRIITACTTGPIMVMFALGLFIPWANIWGAYTGFLSSLAFALWIGIGSHIHAKISRTRLPLSAEHCPNDTVTSVFTSGAMGFTSEDFTTMGFTTDDFRNNFTTDTVTESEPFFQPLYDVSFVWFHMYIVLTGIIIGALVSFVTSGCSFARDKSVDRSLMFNGSACCCSRGSSTEESSAAQQKSQEMLQNGEIKMDVNVRSDEAKDEKYLDQGQEKWQYVNHAYEKTQF